MTYKIAVASSDGMLVNRSFKNASEFLIIKVLDNCDYKLDEIRKYNDESSQQQIYQDKENTCISNGVGQNSSGGGSKSCGGENSPKLKLIEDCRSIVCTQIGFKIQKQLEKRAISAFEINCRIDKALEKIILYYDKVDKHQSLRDFSNKKIL